MTSRHHLFLTSCLLAVLLATVAVVSGCKTDEAQGAGFIDKSNMAKDPSVPFQKSWKKPGFDKSQYTRLYVAPVNTQYMLGMTEWQQGGRKEEFQADIAKLAGFTQDAIRKAFLKDPQQRMEIIDSPGTLPGTLTVEIALIEVVPSKVALNALGYAPFGIGLAVNTVRAVQKDVSSCAFEGRIRDAATGEIVATMADREVQQYAPVSVRGLTWYSNAETIITQWADQFVKLANRKPGESVKDVDSFTLKPW